MHKMLYLEGSVWGQGKSLILNMCESLWTSPEWNAVKTKPRDDDEPP